MVSRTMGGGLGLIGDWDLGEDGWKDGMDANLLKLSVLVQGGAIGLVDATPGSPVEGSVYLFSAAHPTNANAVAVYDEAAWTFYAPNAGWLIYDNGAAVYRSFTGTEWAELETGGGGVEEAPVDDVGYVRKNGTWEPESEGGAGGGVVPSRKSARFWRLRATGLNPANTNGSPTIGFVGIVFRDNAGADITTGGTPIASSFTAGYPASQAFDGNDGTAWYSTSNRNIGEWIGYDFGAKVAPYSFVIQPGAGFPQGTPRNIALDYSDDGLAWTPHTVYFVDSDWVASVAKTFVIGRVEGGGGVGTVEIGAHRYWLLKDWTNTQGSADPVVGGAALALRETVGGAALAVSAITATDTLSGYPASNLVDGNAATFWVAQYSSNPALVVDLGSAKSVRQVAWTGRPDSPYWNQSPRGFNLYFSDDGLTWNLAAPILLPAQTGAGQTSVGSVPTSIVGSGGVSVVKQIADAASNLLAEDVSRYLRFTATSAKTLTVQPESTVPQQANAEWHIRNAAAANLTIAAGSGVTINAPYGGTLIVPPQATVTLKRVAADTYDLMGQTT